MNFLYVALGGAIGAISRYAISLVPIKTEFPVLTLITNLIGAVLIGFIVGFIADGDENSKKALLFWKTGVCGGFTTFSTFSLEAFSLFENQDYAGGGVYIVLSILGCIAGVFIGKKLAIMFA